MASKLIVGNWKMNCLLKESLDLTKNILKKLKNCPNEVVLCPPFPLLVPIYDTIKESRLTLGAQDCHDQHAGAYTGDVSPVLLKNIGCEYVILGHSERRLNHKEISRSTKKKADSAIKADLKVIICIGETLEQRHSRLEFEIIRTQIRQSIPKVANEKNTIILRPDLGYWKWEKC